MPDTSAYWNPQRELRNPTQDENSREERKDGMVGGSWEVIETALAELRRGRMVLVVDDEDRENEGDLIMAAEKATPETIAFMIRHTSGILCVGIPDERADQLRLPLMVTDSDDPRGTAFTVSVDAKTCGTGVSATDRAMTIRALVDSATQPEDLSRPGHIFPLRARAGGVLQRTGHTESAVDLCRLAGLAPAGVLAEVTNDDGAMARRPELIRFAQTHGLTMISVADIVDYRRATEASIHREAEGRVPTPHGEFTAITYRSHVDGVEHVALVCGNVDQASTDPTSVDAEPVLVRVHSECLTGDVFASLRCDCGEQLDRAMAKIGEAGRGVIVYLRGHDGRGIGLSHKLRAYTLQDAGLDTVDANLMQGLPVDSRDYGVSTEILRDLGVRDVRLMSNNPAKSRGLAAHDVRVVAREPLVITPNPENIAYLTTKRTRLDHELGTAFPLPASGTEML